MNTDQTTALAQHAQELSALDKALTIVANGNTFLTNLGKGISVPVTALSGPWFVEVGAGIVLEKSSHEVQALLKHQQTNIENALKNA